MYWHLIVDLKKNVSRLDGFQSGFVILYVEALLLENKRKLS